MIRARQEVDKFKGRGLPMSGFQVHTAHVQAALARAMMDKALKGHSEVPNICLIPDLRLCK